MNQHRIYHLHLSTWRAVALGVGLGVLGLLAFGGGFVLGIAQQRSGDGLDLAGLCRDEVRQACGDPMALAAWRGAAAEVPETTAEPTADAGGWSDDLWDQDDTPDRAPEIDLAPSEESVDGFWSEEIPSQPGHQAQQTQPWQPEPADTSDPRQLAELMNLALRDEEPAPERGEEEARDDETAGEEVSRAAEPEAASAPPTSLPPLPVRKPAGPPAEMASLLPSVAPPSRGQGEPALGLGAGQPGRQTSAASRHAPYTVQVGAFRELENAYRLVAHLAQRSYQPYLHVRDDPQGRRWHTVRLADFATKTEAVAAARDFQQRESLEAVVRAKDPF